MTRDEARKIIALMSDGINPLTGEVLPTDHLLQHGDCVRALAIVVSTFDEDATNPKRKKTLPSNAGRPWSPTDDQELAKLFLEGTTLLNLRDHFQRTRGAILTRLQRLALIKIGDAVLEK